MAGDSKKDPSRTFDALSVAGTADRIGASCYPVPPSSFAT
jgi:hypothetical protein